MDQSLLENQSSSSNNNGDHKYLPMAAPHLQSWMHERTLIPRKTLLQKNKEYETQIPPLRFAQALVSRLIKRLKALTSNRKWIFYRIVMGYIWIIMKILHRIEVYGRENIPKQGGIFIANHTAGSDVVVPFMSMFRQPIGVFTDMGVGFFTDVATKFGIVPRSGFAPEMIEGMIYQLWKVNHYFVMWPEGTPDKGNGVMQGFSGITKVYSTLNVDKDRIPFVPVVMQESPKPITPEKRNEILQKLKFSPKMSKHRIHRRIKQYLHPGHGPCKLIFTILQPVFIPRDWLQPPTEGGKTAREITDYIMTIIARKLGQKELSPNPVLNSRKADPGKGWH